MKNELTDQILNILKETVEGLTINGNDLDQNLSAAGMDSIAFIQVIIALEEAFDCEIPDSKLLLSELNTVNKICAVLDGLL